MSGRYIVVEGPIAVGKTSLAERLAESIGARLVLEGTEENPFLRKFYENPEKYAFAAQIFFRQGQAQLMALTDELSRHSGARVSANPESRPGFPDSGFEASPRPGMTLSRQSVITIAQNFR